MKLNFTPSDPHVKTGESFAVNLNLDARWIYSRLR